MGQASGGRGDTRQAPSGWFPTHAVADPAGMEDAEVRTCVCAMCGGALGYPRRLPWSRHENPTVTLCRPKKGGKDGPNVHNTHDVGNMFEERIRSCHPHRVHRFPQTRKDQAKPDPGSRNTTDPNGSAQKWTPPGQDNTSNRAPGGGRFKPHIAGNSQIYRMQLISHDPAEEMKSGSTSVLLHCPPARC